MFSLSDPSTIGFKMPDYKGDIQIIGGWLEEKAGVAYDKSRAVIDPLLKAPVAVQQGVVTYIKGGASTLFSGLGQALSATASAARSTVSSIWEPFSTGTKWAIFALVLLGGLWLFFNIRREFR